MDCLYTLSEGGFGSIWLSFPPVDNKEYSTFLSITTIQKIKFQVMEDILAHKKRENEI